MSASGDVNPTIHSGATSSPSMPTVGDESSRVAAEGHCDPTRKVAPPSSSHGPGGSSCVMSVHSGRLSRARCLPHGQTERCAESRHSRRSSDIGRQRWPSAGSRRIRRSPRFCSALAASISSRTRSQPPTWSLTTQRGPALRHSHLRHLRLPTAVRSEPRSAMIGDSQCGGWRGPSRLRRATAPAAGRPASPPAPIPPDTR